MNHLAGESSPYLIQHRDNPVDWYPWGDEAFERAQREDRPIFLSIGYATCHWCHVMEHESFADEEVAALMNRLFVSIKVDREERPDVDHVYMSVCQLTNGRCGWPLNVVMTPDRRPFFVATYIPKRARFGRPGLMELLPRIGELWQSDRDRVVTSAAEITEALHRMGRAGGDPAGTPDATDSARARDQFAERFDREHGGFGAAPKFPSPHNLMFLLRFWRRTGDEHSLHMVTRTLRAMRLGGIFDQVGFGFHRYSTDASWKLPHFEKMLYDQALHLMVYTEAALATADSFFKQTARQIAEYVLRDLQSPHGGFYSAEDADSEGEEGRFYVWSAREIDEALPLEDARFVREMFHVSAEGNFEDEASGVRTGANVLYLTSDEALMAPEISERLDRVRRTLMKRRDARPRPLLDDKVLTDWNGLMIAALSRAGSAFQDTELVEAAKRAAESVLTKARRNDGRLYHRSRGDEVGIDGMLDDYVFLSWGLVELYEATLSTTYLASARDLMALAIELFMDTDRGGFFLSTSDSADLLIRPKDFTDGALPSGNAIAALNLLRLSRLTGDRGLEEVAENTLAAGAPFVRQYSSAFAAALLSTEFLESAPTEVVLAGAATGDDVGAMHRAIAQRFLPSTVVLMRDPADDRIAGIAPFAKEFGLPAGARVAAYVCRDHVCRRPVFTVGEMLSEIDGGS